jgi:NAD(P)H-hydrate epimerase
VKTVTAAQMRELDRRTIESGTPGRELMERAGVGVADAIIRRGWHERGPIVLFAGKGNNGGDAFVVARHLALRTNAKVSLLLACKKTEIKDDALYHFRKLPKNVRRATHLSDFTGTIVDGLLGTGLQGEVRSPYRELIEEINAQKNALVVAIDIPSGLQADTGEPLGVAVRADLTATMGLPKVGLLKPAAVDWVGELKVVDIGIPPKFVAEIPSDVELISEADVAPLLPRRKRSAHKGDFGHLLVLAGAQGYHGAAVLCAEAAARAGAGLVTLGVPQAIYPVVAAQCREIMVRPFPDSRDGSFAFHAADEVRSWFEVCNAVALGPGLSQNEETRNFVLRTVTDCPRPLVIDADGLNALASHIEVLRKREAPTVITPHPGEMGRLIGKTSKEVQAARWDVARKAAKEFGVTVVLKGAGTVIASSNTPLSVNHTGGPALAKGGSGDILTGVIASLTAQGLSPLDAARAGVFLHGRAADFAAAKLGDRSALASDVTAEFGEAMRSLR